MSLARFMLFNFARKKFISHVTDRYYLKGPDSLNSIHTRVLKRNSLVQLLPAYYKFTRKNGSRFLDFCINRKEQYEIISSKYVLEADVYRNEKRSRTSIKMYRIVFYSVINAMIFYNTLKSVLTPREF